MNTQRILLDFLLREWLLLSVTVGLVATSLHLRQMPTLSRDDLEIVYVLAILFVVVKGLEQSHLLLHISQQIVRGRFLCLKLVCMTFFLSTVITNDVALLVIVPITLTHDLWGKDMVVILEALAANAGSALTPIGNPQNLFIYWHYGLDVRTFVATIAPFSLLFLVLLGLASLALDMRQSIARQQYPPCAVKRSGFAYLLLLPALILIILRLLPLQGGIIILAAAILLDRGCLRIDYVLLLTLVCFFGLAENIKIMLAARVLHTDHVFILSSLASQMISNVPATLLFSKFTDNWQALLWGTNTGGFGSLVGSLANLISYRLYITSDTTDDPAAFAVRFTLAGYLAFSVAVCFYLVLRT